ncbi:GLPGLI family protein [Chryseobacterium sp. TY3]
MRKIKQSKVNFRISKTYPIFEIVYHSMIHATNLAIKAVDKIKWTVLSERKTIEKFTAKKATTYFGGRNRIAWFTNDIQIQDGLYKFCGLPGLLLTIEDDKANHQFKFVGNQKIENEERRMDSSMKEIFVTKKKLNVLWNDYKKDPAKNIKLMHSSSQMSETLFYNADNGSLMSKQDLIKGKQQRAAESIKKNNNFIDVALYKLFLNTYLKPYKIYAHQIFFVFLINF